MNRKLGVIAGLVLVLVVGHTANAGTLAGSATISIDDETPEYGQTIILTAEVDSDDVASIRTVCTHAAGQSFGFGSISGDEILTDDVGLYAPNWVEGPATCVASVTLLEYSRHGVLKKTLVIASLTFEVAA